ncbi:CPBP family intramembrane glutamic endopeptidase [Mesobaculum littorinae]|nr:type II CAAX endopeptidase family protein [Mesobaculum littorinae]
MPAGSPPDRPPQGDAPPAMPAGPSGPLRTVVFDLYVRPAQRHPAIWRLLLGLVLCLGVYVAWIAVTLFVSAAVWPDRDFWGVAEAVAVPELPVSTLILMATFAGMALGPMIAARLLQGRRPGTLFGPARRLLRDFVLGAGTVIAVYLPALALWALVFDARPNLAPATWVALLPLSALGLLIQTGAEEILFRGYLGQQLAARFRSPAIWLLVPALLFGALHYDPVSAGANTLAVVASAALFGLLAADLVRVSGGLGASWGMHFANNAVALLVLTTQGSITGLSLWLTPYALDDEGPLRWLMLGDAVLITLIWAVLRWRLTRLHSRRAGSI